MKYISFENDWLIKEAIWRGKKYIENASYIFDKHFIDSEDAVTDAYIKQIEGKILFNTEDEAYLFVFRIINKHWENHLKNIHPERAEKRRLEKKAWQQNNPDRVRVSQYKWNAKNTERKKETEKKYRKNRELTDQEARKKLFENPIYIGWLKKNHAMLFR